MGTILAWWQLPVVLAIALGLLSASIRAFRGGRLVTAYVTLQVAEVMPISLFLDTPLGRVVPLPWQVFIFLGCGVVALLTLLWGVRVMRKERANEQRERVSDGQP